MKTKKFILALAALTIAATAFIACSSDDDDNNNNGQNVPESEAVTSYDDLSFFQNAIVSIDSLGNFLCRHYGQPLYDNDTTQLYIGVETLAQAEEIFTLVEKEKSLKSVRSGSGYADSKEARTLMVQLPPSAKGNRFVCVKAKKTGKNQLQMILIYMEGKLDSLDKLAEILKN